MADGIANDWITIGSDALKAAINPFGAELSSLRDADGRELMTDADPAFWTGRAPILFPIVGAVNQDMIRVAGQSYPIAKHGFARHSAFTVAAQTHDHVQFQLTDSERTRQHYPFAFLLEIDFRVSGSQLDIEARIENRSDSDMPAQFGFHPAFAWPLPFGEPRADHRITFAEDEPGALKRLLPDGLIAPDERPSPLDGRELLLRDELFTDDALIWRPVRSQSVRYGAGRGPTLEIAFPDTPALGIWTKPVLSDAAGGVGGPGAHFICIEPWHGIADPEGFTGQLRDKPGVFVLAPGAERRCQVSVTVVK